MDYYYNGTITSCSNAYSSASSYGSNGIVNTIINPVPAVARPQIFCKYKPHSIYQPPELFCDNNKNKYEKLDELPLCKPCESKCNNNIIIFNNK
jgi:hypothetical protein